MATICALTSQRKPQVLSALTTFYHRIPDAEADGLSRSEIFLALDLLFSRHVPDEEFKNRAENKPESK